MTAQAFLHPDLPCIDHFPASRLRDLPDRAGSPVEINREEDPLYHVVDDRLA